MSGKKNTKSNFFQKSHEIKRCNDLRARIKSYCKQENFTQPQFAEKMGVSKSQMNSFMTGSALTGSEVYLVGMKYLRTRMPLSKCSEEDINKIENNKWSVTFGK